MKQLLIVGLLATSMPLLAQLSFPVYVELEAQGLDLISTSTGNVGNVATVTLTNQESREIGCVATFVNGPEKPAPLRVRLAAGEKTVLTQAFQRDIIQVRASIECNAN
ncbi:MAG: hypothetical protein ACJAXR_002186 [Halopseudomonas sp.]|jgi:hypothetical protein|uniref:hypothetical protein n=1 Tax=Halopseudomonas sp. TaxID=2901191 RepID=UPI0039E3C49F